MEDGHSTLNGFWHLPSMNTTAIFAIVVTGVAAFAAWRSLSKYLRRTHNSTADLTVSDSWLAEQRGRRADER